MLFRAILIFGLATTLACLPRGGTAQVVPGALQTESYLPLLRGKRIGVVANAASRAGDSDLVTLLLQRGIKVRTLFSPEHGYRLSSEAGAEIAHGRDSATGIRIVSLYGAVKKPPATDLKQLDLMLFDLQDVGVRFYTYISTLTYVMEACAENGVPLVVLDRPNPNGYYVDGPVLEKKFRSFVGLHPVPVVYGMTIGEYARMVNGEEWLNRGARCTLQVIPLQGYDRTKSCTLPVPPSPNLPDSTAVTLYPSLCFFEGTAVSVGRGTPHPFSVYGHPDLGYGGFEFIPQSIPGISENPPCRGQRCRGEDLRDHFRRHPRDSGRLVLGWLIRAHKEWKGDQPFFNSYFEKLAGTAVLRKQVEEGKNEEQIRRSWQPGIRKFMKIREKYLLY